MLSTVLACTPRAEQSPTPVSASAPASVPARRLALTHVTVIDVIDGTQHPEQTVVIAGSRIQSVGPTTRIQVPAGAQVIDARGKYLIPGLWDMHVHVHGYPDVFYPLLIANGVTGIRDMGTAIPLDTVHQWQQEVTQGTRVGPRQLNAGASLDDGGPWGCKVYPFPLACPFHRYPFLTPVRTPARARALVDSLKAAGADFIKVHEISHEAYFAILAQARQRGIAVAGHLTDGVTIEDAIDSGQRTFEHTDGIQACLGDSATLAGCTALAPRLRRHNAWIVSGPAGRSGAVPPREWRARLRYWPDSLTRKQWLADSMGEEVAKNPLSSAPDARFRAAMQRIQRAGLPLLAGSDAMPMGGTGVPGFLLQDGLMNMVERGFTPLFALQTATLNPAKYLNATDSLGTIAPGKLADLVLLDGNPLVNIQHLARIRAVVANGRYFDHTALDALLAAVEQRGAPHWAR